MRSNTIAFKATTLLLAWVLLSLFAATCSHHTGESAVSPLSSPPESSLMSATVSLQATCNPVNASQGAVTGRLYVRAAHSTVDQPAIGSVLYLGEYIGLETGRPSVILDISRHPHTETGEGGWFCFSGVSPGTYGLIVWDAVESVLLNHPTTGLSLMIEVRAGETVNLGTLYSPIP